MHQSKRALARHTVVTAAPSPSTAYAAKRGQDGFLGGGASVHGEQQRRDIDRHRAPADSLHVNHCRHLALPEQDVVEAEVRRQSLMWYK
jgi:hypothetical protein